MGMRAVHAGKKSKEIRIKRYETGSTVLNLAKKNNVDFVIIAGDTFEHNDVDEIVVKKTVDILNQFAPIPVFILPGNHDPFLPGAIWDRTSWHRVGSHIILLNDEMEYNLNNGITLYPCPVKQKRSSIDPTIWIPKRLPDDKRIRIGIAHGSLDILPDSINFPIAKSCAKEKGLDYLALGDWHSFFQYDRALYPGSFEPTSYNEHDSGNVVIVEISAPGISPTIEKIKCCSLNWAEFSVEIKDITDIEKLEKSIRMLGPLASLVLRIHVHLYLSQDGDFIQQLESFRAELDEGAFYLEWDQDEEMPIDDNTAIRLPEGILHDMDESLQNILQGKIPQPPCHVFAGQDRLVVQKARNLLFTFERRRKK
ncbi:MAG: metallophosphoesterase [Methanolinea sp.]|jgi:DNA repair exonuclease SbcCD nuclease subunit|nr:metallophosphoesterase [Methanolinea sp.]